jgi:hypothetical protein
VVDALVGQLIQLAVTDDAVAIDVDIDAVRRTWRLRRETRETGSLIARHRPSIGWRRPQ